MSAMPAADQVEIRRLGGTELQAHLDGLAGVLADCVAGGASVSYMAPFSQEQALAIFEDVAAEVEKGRRLLLAAFADGQVVGTVQVILALPPNQPHRAEIAKLLVHRSARRRSIAQLLMEQAESEARAEGKTLLVLDTVTGDNAERLYARLGWTRVGVIPGYALYPDGRPCDSTVFWKALLGGLERGPAGTPLPQRRPRGTAVAEWGRKSSRKPACHRDPSPGAPQRDPRGAPEAGGRRRHGFGTQLLRRPGIGQPAAEDPAGCEDRRR
jgi:GNAT superfamily N-acetyltransferase